MSNEKENSVKHFLDLIQKSRKGKFKVYIGMSAGVGKTFRMLQETHTLLKNGIDVKIGYIETHNRAETHALLDGLPIIPRRSIFYKGKQLEEMDVQAIINLRPEVVIVDELRILISKEAKTKNVGRMYWKFLKLVLMLYRQ